MFNYTSNSWSSRRACHLLKEARDLIAKTTRETSWDLRDGVEMKASGNNDLLNFNNWDVKASLTFEPYFDHHYFVHKARYFLLKRKERQITSFGVGFRDQEIVELACIRRSTQSIKNLIDEAHNKYFKARESCNVVRRPASKKSRDIEREVWNKVATRSSRPIKTVV